MLSLNLASGGVYMAYLVTKVSVVSYTTFSPSPQLKTKLRQYISVALSLKSPSPAINRHPVLLKLGLSSELPL